MHRAALDRPGSDQCHFHHQVIEHPRFQARQGGHLGTGLHLEHPHRIGALQHLVDARIGQVETGQIDLDALMRGDQVNGVVQCRQHAQAEQIELHQTDCRAIIFVPLQYSSIRHPGPFHRAHIGDRPIADHHSAGMDTQMPGQIGDLVRQVGHRLRDVVGALAPGVLLTLREAQRPGHIPDRAASAVSDHVGDLGGVVAAVAGVDVLDDAFAKIRLDIDVDIGRPVTRRGQESFEEQAVGHRIDGGDAEGVTDRRVGRRPAALAQDVIAAAELGDVVHHQEVAREIEAGDDVEFPFYLRIRRRSARRRTVPSGCTDHHQLTQPAVLGVPLRGVEGR